MPVEIGFIHTAGPGFASCPLLAVDALCDPYVRPDREKRLFSKDSVLRCQGAVLGQAFPPRAESGSPVLKYLKSEVFSIHKHY